MSKCSATDFYVYEHRRTDSGVVFYVGKGRKYRAFDLKGRNIHHRRITKKVIENGFSVQISFFAIDLTEKMAFDLERERIAYWRSQGFELCNQTDGGGGGTGPKSPEHIEKVAAAHRGMKRPPKKPETIAKMSLALKGRKQSPEHIKNAADARRGKKLSLEARLNMSRGQKGRIISEETKRKMSIAGRGKVHSAEWSQKIADSRRGKKNSAEASKNMRLGWIKRRLKPITEETRMRQSQAQIGRTHSEQTKQKMRASRYRYLLKSGGLNELSR